MLKRGRERKQAFHNVKNQSQAKPEENGHEEEGLLRAEAPVALGGESLGLCASLLELIAVDRQEEGWRAHGSVSAA